MAGYHNNRCLKIVLLCCFAMLFICMYHVLMPAESIYSIRIKYMDLEATNVTEQNTSGATSTNQPIVNETQNTTTRAVKEYVLAGETYPEPDDFEYIHLMTQEIPNVPFDFWMENRKNKMQYNNSCAKHPNIFDINIHNTFWQTFHLDNVTLQLYNAYYDNRTNVDKRPLVRIIAMANQLGYKFANSYCQLWSANSIKPMLVPVMEYKNMWPTYWGRHQDAFYPHLLSCQVPDANIVPKAVSLVSSPCQTARNILRVHFEQAERKERFAVCVKGLDFPYVDISIRLIEWLELMRILGAAKAYIYYFHVHPNVLRVLQYYRKQGFVETQPITLANGVPDTVYYQHLVLQRLRFNKRQNEIVPYNDCLYRNLYKYEYVSAIDIDEVILPRNNLSTWHDLMNIAEAYAKLTIKKCPYGYVSICFRHTHVPVNLSSNNAGIPKFMHLLQHTQRAQEPQKIGIATKCFHNTSDALSLHNHYALNRSKSCAPTTLDLNVGHLLHYHQLKPNELNLTTVEDTNILRFSGPLIERVKQTMVALGFLVYS